MGFFSFKCAKSGKSISNKYSIMGATPCVLVTPEGNYKEYDYEGYGEFGGIDVFVWLAYANGLVEGNLEDILNNYSLYEKARDAGIELYFKEDKPEDYKPIKIVALDAYEGEKYDELPASEDDEAQGFFY